jgi:hypothetical protein
MNPSQMMVEGWMNGKWLPHRPETWPAYYGELPEDTVFYDFNQRTRETTKRTVPAGTTVRIVMASRFGDVGITDDLSRERGYGSRLCPEQLSNLRKTPTPNIKG